MTTAILKSADVVLPQLPAGWWLASAQILADGSLVLLATDVDLQHEWRRDVNGSVLGKPFEVAASAKGKLWSFDGQRLVEGPSFSLETPFPLSVDRFENGCWMIVARRTEVEPNARVLMSDGKLLRRFMLGDGIEHVGIDRRDQIWVGWFDEGIYGNEKWRVEGEQWPPSSLGVGLFSSDGTYLAQKVSTFVASISDCYALNVVGDEAWACPYVDFPLLRIRPNQPVRRWSNKLSGATALAIFEGHALLAGGYGEDANRLALLTLGDGGNEDAAQILETWRLPLVRRYEPLEAAKNFPWQRPALLDGRGESIHLVQDGVWHRWRVSDAVAAANRA